jgi:hypothetical protein
MTIVSMNVWQPGPGRAADFAAGVSAAKKIHERLGARVTVWQTVVGGTPNTVAYTTEFDDMTAFGTFADKLATDEEWQAFWAAATSSTDAIATLVDTVLVSEVEGL